ncbi:MAG: tRNA 5-hydroxyuridine modification protein YegQ [Thiotrichales bacterium]
MAQIELLAPAGSLKAMRYAFAFGADAIYAGQPRYSLRVRNNAFHGDTLARGIAEAHALGKRFFLTTNVIPHNGKVRSFLADLEPVIALGPDALIMADPGLIMLVRERWPALPIHLSVQANTVNFAAVRFWKSVGIERIILSRELSLEEIEEIRQACPDTELEVFVHGALCIAYSGRCLLSGYFNHRDPNQGTCTNACRWDYATQPATETAEGVYKPVAEQIQTDRHPDANQVHFLQEKSRPDELMPMMEDEHGTYILNSRDLRAVEHVHRLVQIGVDCLKIEGRTKSHYYVARTTQVYRQAMDDALAGRGFDDRLVGVLENLSNRGYTDGFYQRHHTEEQQNYLDGASRQHRQQFVGEIQSAANASGLAEISVRNRFSVGDHLEIVTPAGNRDFVLEYMEDMRGQPIAVAPGDGHVVRIPLPPAHPEHTLIARYL